IHAREILDSRGNPTVEVDLYTGKGKCMACTGQPSVCKAAAAEKGVPLYRYGKDATNVGDEGGFAPNILENKEGEWSAGEPVAGIEEELGDKAKFAGRSFRNPQIK
uniref:Enolase n=1 Tax=Petromyzon marinus TaxID=7757 RepID=S4RR08_PETMA